MKKFGLLLVSVILLVFTVSCVSKDVEITETYYETEYKTEYKTETYTETEDVVVRTSEGQTHLDPVCTWQNNSLYFVAAGSGTAGSKYYGYEIDASNHTRSRIKITVSSAAKGAIGVYDLTILGQFPYYASSDMLNSILSNPEYTIVFKPLSAGIIDFDAKDIKEFGIFVNSWNKYAISSVQLVWSDDIVERRTVTKERQIPYQVPVQIEKQRVVIEKRNVPIWNTWKLTEPLMSSSEITESISDNVESSVEVLSPHPLTPEVKTPSELPPPEPKIIYEDDFSNPDSGFNVVDSPDYTLTYRDGEYYVLVNKSDWLAWPCNRSAGIFTDFILEIDTNWVAESKPGYCGITFCVKDNDNFYFLYISRGGYFVGERFQGNWRAIQPWTASEYVKKDATNQLKVIHKDSLIEVYINGHYLKTIEDPFHHFSSGYVGVIVHSIAGGTYATFDNLKVYTFE